MFRSTCQSFQISLFTFSTGLQITAIKVVIYIVEFNAHFPIPFISLLWQGAAFQSGKVYLSVRQISLEWNDCVKDMKYSEDIGTTRWSSIIENWNCTQIKVYESMQSWVIWSSLQILGVFDNFPLVWFIYGLIGLLLHNTDFVNKCNGLSSWDILLV